MSTSQGNSDTVDLYKGYRPTQASKFEQLVIDSLDRMEPDQQSHKLFKLLHQQLKAQQQSINRLHEKIDELKAQLARED